MAISCYGQPPGQGDDKNSRPPRGERGHLQPLQIGDVAPDFTLTDVDGYTYSLTDMQGDRGSIIIFTSNTCPFAVASEQRMIDLHHKTSEMGYAIIAINPNDQTIEEGDSFEQMISRHRERKMPYRYLKDVGAEVCKTFGATKTPHAFVLSSDRKVQYIGAIDDSPRDPDRVDARYLEDAVSALYEGRTPDPQTTKAIGCAVKTSRMERGRDRGPEGRGGEPPSPEQIMQHMDSDGDGSISKNEARGPLARDFDRLDTDRDGVITSEELKAAPRRNGPR